jgi:hypothetical protein
MIFSTMKMRILPFLILLSWSCQAQIVISNGTNTPTQLVDGILVPSGSSTAVSNVNFRGCLNTSGRYQLGAFSASGTTATQLGFTSGLVLSTGNTAHIPLTPGTNPGSVAQMSTNYTSGTAGEIRSSNSAAGQDSDAATLIAPENYYNAAVLEFDFIPASTFLSFNYVFGSEEYDDQSGSAFGINYNCSAYHDKFAFLLSGPGISGGQGYLNDAVNIARLGNNSEVSINAVNSGLVGSSGGFPNAANCLAANPDWTTSPTAEFQGFIDGTELNGNTIVLNAFYSGLIPGQSYHIRLLIADAKDGAYDSVVYLEAGSFTTTTTNLPVEFMGMEAQCETTSDLLTWTTGSERNNAYFQLEQSLDGTHFETVDSLPSQGDSDTPQYYALHVEANAAAQNYYRLSQRDLNGVLTTLTTLVLRNDCRLTEPEIRIDAAQQQLTVYSASEALEQVELFAFDGKLLAEARANRDAHSDLSLELPDVKGVWIIRITTENRQITRRIHCTEVGME